MLSLFSGLYGRHCLCQVYDANEQGWDHHVLQGQCPRYSLLAVLQLESSRMLWSRCAMVRSTCWSGWPIFAWSTSSSAMLMGTSSWRLANSNFQFVVYVIKGGNRGGWRDSKPYEQCGLWQVKSVDLHSKICTKTFAAPWKATWRKDLDLQITSRFMLGNVLQLQSWVPIRRVPMGTRVALWGPLTWHCVF